VNATPELLTAVVAVLAVGGQLANVILHLTLRAELATMEKRVLDQVAIKYMPREACGLTRASCAVMLHCKQATDEHAI